MTAQEWAVVEICSGIICASLVPLRPLYKKIFACWQGRSGRMAHQKLHAKSAPDSPNQDFRSRAKGEPETNLNVTVLTARAESIDIEKSRANMTSDVSVLQSDSQHQFFKLPETALTRNSEIVNKR